MTSQNISELLFNHDCVIIPGLGGFLSSYLPARISKESNTFFPPSSQIAFNASLSSNDGLLASHIAQKCAISYREAQEDIRKWVESVVKDLNSGLKVELENIGCLELNPEGNIQFEPEVKTNFLGNSFGLPIFEAIPLQRDSHEAVSQNIERVQSWPSKLKYLVPATLKWAAVLAPFIAFTLWGSLNSDIVGNYVQNYSGLFSWVRTTPGKTATITYNQPPNSAVKHETIFQHTSPAAVLNDQKIEFTPGAITNKVLQEGGLLEKPDVEPVNKSFPSESQKYFIIGGAFREYSNAVKMTEKLKAEGFQAEIIDTTSSGLYVVSMKHFEKRVAANEELAKLKEAGYGGAWIMRKKS